MLKRIIITLVVTFAADFAIAQSGVSKSSCALAADDYRAAKSAYYANKTAEASQLAARALKEDPWSVDAHRMNGLLLAEEGKPDEAMAEYHKALEIDPDDAWTFYDMALVLDDQGKLRESEITLDKAVALKREDAAIFNNRGWARYQQKHLEAARADFLTALAIDPEKASARLNLAHVNADTGHYKEALVDLNWVLDRRPDQIEALEVRAQAYNGLKMTAKANADKKKADELRKAKK